MDLPPGIQPDDVDDRDVDHVPGRSADHYDDDETPFGTPLNWIGLEAVRRRHELRRLRPFVAELVAMWEVPATVVPACWERHDPIVFVLSSVRDAHDAAFADAQPGSASSDWLRVWQWALAWLGDLTSTTACKTRDGHTPGVRQEWADDVASHGEISATWGAMEALADVDYEKRVAHEARRAALRVVPRQQEG